MDAAATPAVNDEMYVESAARHKATLVGLDGIRGAAAIVVLMWHSELFFGFKPASGYLAVDIFFILSGFVLSYAYDDRFAAGLSPVTFIISRVIRLYPLYILGLTIAALAVGLSVLGHQPLKWTLPSLSISLLTSYLFIPTPNGIGSNGDLFPLNPPAWSLAFELAVNLLFGCAWRWLSSRTLILVIVFAGAAEVAAASINGSLDVGSSWSSALFGISRVLYSFTAGVLLYRMHRRRPVKMLGGAYAPIVIIVAILMISPPSGGRAVYDVICAMFLFPILVVWAVSGRSGRLRSIYTVLGAISYALYALHLPIFSILSHLVVRFWHGSVTEFQPWFGWLFLAVMLIIAYLADRCFDGPIRRRLSSLAHPISSSRNVASQVLNDR